MLDEGAGMYSVLTTSLSYAGLEIASTIKGSGLGAVRGF